MTRDKRTLAVHAGTRRSQYSEMSEAIFMTQSFVYESAEAAESRFEQAGRMSLSMLVTATQLYACLKSG